MRKISIDFAKEDMILGKTVFTTSGAILLNSGTKLKKSYIDSMKSIGIAGVYIEDYLSVDIYIEDIVSEETKFEAQKAVKINYTEVKSNYKVAECFEFPLVMKKTFKDQKAIMYRAS